MPNIFVKIPQDAFPGECRAVLVQKLNDAAAAAERMPPAPAQRVYCWVVVDEAAPGAWTCGGVDAGAWLLPCAAVVYVPAGVLDDAARALYVELVHAAFVQALPDGERRRLATSVLLREVGDGEWGINGAVWRLPDFARAAGYAHLQALLTPAAP